MFFPSKKLWLPGRKQKQPCLKNGYAQTLKDAREYRDRFRFNPLAKVAGMFVPKPLRMSPGYPCCCCNASKACMGCSNGYASESFQIVIAGIATISGGCNDCANLNNTYIVEYEFSIGGECYFGYYLPSSICNYNHLTFHIDPDLNEKLSVWFSSSSFIFRKTGVVNCCEIKNLELPLYISSSICDLTNATCYITML